MIIFYYSKNKSDYLVSLIVLPRAVDESEKMQRSSHYRMKALCRYFTFYILLLFASLSKRLVSSQSCIGSYVVYNGPYWGTSPPTYSCVQACALLYGGQASSYAGSIYSSSISYTCYGVSKQMTINFFY